MHRGLKLTEHCLKVIERLIKKLIHDIVEVSDMQFGFMSGRGTSGVIFIVQYVSYKNISGCPWALLYADDLFVISESLECVLEKLWVWKLGLESNGLKLSIRKTKVIFCGPNLNTQQDSRKYPCGVCHSGAGRNSIFCNACSHWVHKQCSNIHGRLTAYPAY